MPFTKQALILKKKKITIEINCELTWYLKIKDICEAINIHW